MEIKTDYEEIVVVIGRATAEGGAHVIVWADGLDACTVSLSVPQVKQLRKELKKAAGL